MIFNFGSLAPPKTDGGGPEQLVGDYGKTTEDAEKGRSSVTHGKENRQGPNAQLLYVR